MKKIESLTPEQESQFSVYSDKWTKIGLCTKRANRAVAESWCKKAYEAAGLKAPKMIFWAESPMGLLITAKIVKALAAKGFLQPHAAVLGTESVGAGVGNSVLAGVVDSVLESVGASVRSGVRSGVEGSVENSVGNSIKASAEDSVWESVWESVWARVRESVEAGVRAGVKAGVWNSVGDSVGDSVWKSVGNGLKIEWNECNSWGQHDASWFGFIDYFREVLDLKDETEKLIPLMELAKETGWHMFYKDIAILSEKPTELHRNANGRLHCDGAPAIKWADGYELFRLNGVPVSKEIAEMPKDAVTRETITKEYNADVRREIIRKAGNDRLAHILDYKVMHAAHGYELISFDIGDGRVRPFLKMINPSIDAIHIEGVHPDVKTVEEAIVFRNGLKTYTAPVVLT